MVKRSRDQSQEAPSRLSCLMMVPPDSAFQPRPSPELFAPDRPPARLLPLHHLALHTIWVAMPA